MEASQQGEVHSFHWSLILQLLYILLCLFVHENLQWECSIYREAQTRTTDKLGPCLQGFPPLEREVVPNHLEQRLRWELEEEEENQ